MEIENAGTDEDLCALLGAALIIADARGYSSEARFEKFSGLNAKMSADFSQKRIVARVSDGYRAAGRGAVVGLFLFLLKGIFKRLPERAEPYLEKYAEFSKRRSFYSLDESLKRLRGRKRRGSAKGEAHDLNAVLSRTIFSTGLYRDFEAIPSSEKVLALPKVFWSREKSRRRLAFYDSAANEVVVSRLFDSEKVPEFVIQYLLFHELLHAKHDPYYERGETKRRMVHHGDFKKEERSFAQYDEAEKWLKQNMRRLR